MGSNKAKPFPPGPIPGGEVLRVEKEAPFLERFVYRVRFPVCGHEGLLLHRTVRNRIRLGYSGHTYLGLCASCSRTKQGRDRVPRKKQKPRTLHETALAAFDSAARKPNG